MLPQLPWVITLGILLFTGLGLQLVLPQIIRYFIDEAQKGSPLERLTAAAVLFIVVTLVQQIVQVFATYFSERVGWTATNNIREDLAEHALSLDMAYHNEHTPGEMIERIDGDPNELGTFFSLFIFRDAGKPDPDGRHPGAPCSARTGERVSHSASSLPRECSS